MTDAPQLLREAAALIDERAAQRDLPKERSMRRAVSAFNALAGTTLTETQGWLFMAVLKLSRALGGRFSRDDLLDGAAYMALALECELEAPEKPAEAQEAVLCHGETEYVAQQESGPKSTTPSYDPGVLQRWLALEQMLDREEAQSHEKARAFDRMLANWREEKRENPALP